MEKQSSFRNATMEKQQSFRNGAMEKQQSFRNGAMEKQKSFRGLMEKQKSFRIAMERQLSFGGDRRKSKDSPGKRGDSQLHLAARAGNLGKVKEIIHKFESINNGVQDLLSKQNLEGETPLYVAAENGHTLVVGEFLKHSDAETSSIPANNGYDPFHVAAKQGHLDVLKELLCHFPSLVMTTDVTNSTALHTAAAQGHTDVVNLLLDFDSNLAKIPRNDHETVLHTVARMGHLEVVKALLDKDPSLGFRTDKKGQTALHKAVEGQNVEIVMELMKPYPSVLGLEDNEGNTALHIATRKGRNQIVQCLTSKEGIDVNATNSIGETPLDITEKFGTPELVAILKEAGAVHSKDHGKPQTAAKQLKQTVSDIKHDVQSQLQQTRQTSFGLVEHISGSDASEGSQGSAYEHDPLLTPVGDPEGSTSRAVAKATTSAGVSVFEVDKFSHDFQKECLEKLWAYLREQIKKTPTKSISSLNNYVSLVVKLMKSLSQFDISHLEYSLDTLLAKATAYDDARSQASEKPIKEVIAQQLSKARGRLHKAQTDVSKGAEQIEQTKVKLKNVDTQLAALKEKQEELFKSLALQLEAHEGTLAEVGKIEEEIKIINRTLPLDDKMEKALKSSRASVKAAKRELDNLKPFD